MPILTTIAIGAGALILKKLGNYAIDCVSEEIIGGEEKPDYEGQLKNLLQGQEEIKRRLNDCISKIETAAIRSELLPAYQKIENTFEQMLELPKDHDYADRWAEEVLSPTHGLEAALRNFRRSICGSEIAPSIMIPYAEVLQTNPSPPQSRYFMITQFFRDLLSVQLKGFLVYTAAYRLKEGRDADISEIQQKFSESWTTQAEAVRPIADKLSKWFEEARDFQELVLDIQRNRENHYIELAPNCAPDGRVVVGIQLYQQGNRLALRIKHAAPDANTEIDPASATWQDSSYGPNVVGEGYLDVNLSPYAHMELVEMPEGMVVTGVQFHPFHNRFALKMQGAKLNQDGVSIDNQSKKWIEPTVFENNFYEIEGDNHYGHGPEVLPTPHTFVTGGALKLFGNRLAITMKTSFYTI